jgi:hypothetical protein
MVATDSAISDDVGCTTENEFAGIGGIKGKGYHWHHALY